MKLCIRVKKSVTGEYVAQCPSLPGCISRGSSPTEAQKRLDEAIRGYIAAVSDFVPERVEKEVVRQDGQLIA
jgi:predicted RNase H-like HicB family nuclease